jgi:hypothetical protein
MSRAFSVVAHLYVDVLTNGSGRPKKKTLLSTSVGDPDPDPSFSSQIF